MFYLFNVREWLKEIVETCGRRGLNPSNSLFCLILFTSLDAKYVRFFRNCKEQISSYSGENVHVFTPMVFDHDLIPDGEWHNLRQAFSESGVRLGSGPSIVLFGLKKRARGYGYDPNYFGAFALPERRAVAPLMRDLVSICIDERANVASLLSNVSEAFGKPNLIGGRASIREIRLTAFDNPLHALTIFLSYSHADREVVLHAHAILHNHGLLVWRDEIEIRSGEDIFDRVKRGLDASDAAVLFLSSNSAKSRWLPFEGAYFHGGDSQRAIIPVVLDEEGKALAAELLFTAGRLYVDMSDASQRPAKFQILARQLKDALQNPD